MPPVYLDLAPATAVSSASLGLTVGRASAVVGMPGKVVQTNPASEVHPHDWHLPESLLDAGPLMVTMAAVVTAVAMRERFRFYPRSSI